MIEIKSRIHTTRLFADHTQFGDLFKLVAYFGYRGDISNVPWWYLRNKGYSCVTDLTKGMDEILAGMKSNTRNEIRRAEREGCSFVVVDGYDEFIPFYNAFCQSKGLNDFTSTSRMGKYEKLLITKVVHSGKTMAMHSNILDERSRVALLQFSCSPRLEEDVDKKMIGWANRFLHYKELEWLKAHGYEQYDWSGVCIDPQNPNCSIGKFKLSFGGMGYENYTLRSPLYGLAQMAMSIFEKLRR